MKKKHILFVMLMTLCLSVAGCQKGEDKKTSPTTDKLETEEKADDTETVKYQYSNVIADRTETEGKLAVYFLRGDYLSEDVDSSKEGTGEATLMIAPDGTTMLIDFQNSMVNGAYIAEVLQKLGIEKLDYVVVTSPHAEHLAGYSIVMRTVEIGQVITNEHDFSNDIIYTNFINQLNEKQIPIVRTAEGDVFACGQDVTVEVMNPAKGYEDWEKEDGQRNGALVLKVTYQQSSFLIGGDITESVEEQLIAKHGEKLKCDVVKMNAQGSKVANSKEWVNTVQAKIAVCERNMVENDTIVGRYAMRTETTLHTALDGTCLIYTTGDGSYEVQVEKDRVGDTYLELGTKDGHVTVQ